MGIQTQDRECRSRCGEDTREVSGDAGKYAPLKLSDWQESLVESPVRLWGAVSPYGEACERQTEGCLRQAERSSLALARQRRRLRL